MFIKVTLERIYETNLELEEMDFANLADIDGMDELETLDDNSATITTRLVQGSVVEVESADFD